MSELRYNGLVATLAAPGLTNVATTINFTAALTHSGGTNVPTITGSDYFWLSILNADGVLVEVVKVTAYTAAATSATITRAQQGTTAVAHSAGVMVENAPLVSDFSSGSTPAYSNPIDDPANWAAAGTITDSEFDLGTMAVPITTLPAGWSWFNQGGASYSESLGAGNIIMPAGGLDHRGIVKSLAGAPATWDLYAKCEYPGDLAGAYTERGIIFREAATGKAVQFGIYTAGSGYAQWMILSWTSDSGVSGFGFGPSGIGATSKYWRIRKNSATSYDYMVSRDGKSWFTLLAAANPGFTPDQIGFSAVRNSANGAVEGAIQWMRLR